GEHEVQQSCALREAGSERRPFGFRDDDRQQVQVPADAPVIVAEGAEDFVGLGEMRARPRRAFGKLARRHRPHGGHEVAPVRPQRAPAGRHLVAGVAHTESEPWTPLASRIRGRISRESQAVRWHRPTSPAPRSVDGPTGARADVCLSGPLRAAVPRRTEMVRGAADRLERVAMRLDTLDWNDLRYFLAAARAGTLAGAARLLGVKHPTVGRRLDALERAIGAALVIRTETGIRLTPLGETLVGHAEQVERSVEELKAALPPRPQR